MKATTLKLLIVCGFVIFFVGKDDAKIILEDIGVCHVYENPPIEIKFANVTMLKNGSSFINYDIVLQIPLDAKVGVKIVLEYAATKNKFVTIRTMREKNTCRTLSAYGGPVWTEIMDLAGIPKGCPIQPGHYNIKNRELDISKLAFQAIPIGKVRVNFTLLHNSNKEEFLCSTVKITRV